jgi:regulator of protease activity HflC (stomatin/prohibitin superfamily)
MTEGLLPLIAGIFDGGGAVIVGGVFVLLFLAAGLVMVTRYKRCPSDRILVIFGRVGEGQSARCIHGGGAFVIPVFQDYHFLSLTPLTMNIPLRGALSLQNIRIDVPSTFTVGISVDPNIMSNAAERLLGLAPREIEEMAREIIFGQLRLTVASLTIEQINQDRESFLLSIRANVEPELNKIGLYLINVNITDITDESDYIESIGKKAAAEAVQAARVDVAREDKTGAIGEAEAVREKQIRVAENVAQADKGKKEAEADRRIFIQGQEAQAVKGENDAKAHIAATNAELAIKVAEQEAAADKGRKAADTDRRIFVQGQEAEAIAGENTAKANIAAANATLAEREAEARQRGEVAQRNAQVEIQKATARARGDRQAQGRDRRRGRGREDPPRGAWSGRRHPGPVHGRGRRHPAGARREGVGLRVAGRELRWRRPRGRHAAHDREDRDDRREAGRGHPEPQDRQDHGLGLGRSGRRRLVHGELPQQPDQEPAPDPRCRGDGRCRASAVPRQREPGGTDGGRGCARGRRRGHRLTARVRARAQGGRTG